MTPPLPSEGSLAEVQLPVLLHALVVGRRTCVLDLHHQGIEKQIFFEDGVPVACTSNLVQETLGRYLVEKGVLEEARSLELLAQSLREGKKLGQVIVAAGLLDEVQLQRHLQANLGRRILDSFRWVAARYRLLGLAAIPETALRMNPIQLIYTGVCTTLPLEAVRQAFAPAPAQRFALLQPTLELKLNVRDQLLLSALEGRPTLDELCAVAGMPEEEVSRRLYAWTVIRVVDLAERVPRPAPAPAPAPTVEPVEPAPRPAAAAPAVAEHLDEDVAALRRSGPRRAGKAAVFVVALAGSLFLTRQLLNERPERVAPAPTPAPPVMAPRREFRQPPPLPEPPALPPPTGLAAVQKPRHFTLSESGITLALPKAGNQTGLSKAFFEKGLRALKKDNLEVAADSFFRATLDAPGEPEAWYGVAFTSFELGRDQETLKAVRETLERAPAHPMANLLAGWLEQRAGRTEQARAHYQAYLATPAPSHAAEVQAIVAQLPR